MPDLQDGHFAGLYAWSQDVRAAVHRLDPMQRKVLQLVYFERRTQDEVARELALPRRTVAHAVAAGMQTLATAVLAAPGD